MRNRTLSSAPLLGAALLGLLAFGASKASAQNVINITVDENGHGMLVNPVSGTFVLPSSMAADPGPGGLASALTYNLLGPPGLVTGDVVLLEPGSTDLSEVLRFNSNGTLVFYSDNADGVDALADTGLPNAFNTNVVRISEVGAEGSNGAFYTPTANQPGFVAGSAFPVSYHFISDSTVVPEPGSLAVLAGLSVTGSLFAVSRLKRRRK